MDAGDAAGSCAAPDAAAASACGCSDSSPCTSVSSSGGGETFGPERIVKGDLSDSLDCWSDSSDSACLEPFLPLRFFFLRRVRSRSWAIGVTYSAVS